MSEDLRIIRTNEEVKQMLQYLSDKEEAAVDTETTGVTEDAEIIGYSICAEPNIAYYVITAYWDVASQTLKYTECRDSAPTVMERLSKMRLIMHNGPFDCARVVQNYKVDLTHALHTDTMILAHLLDENRSVGLKELASIAYGSEAKKEQEEMKASVHANGGQLTKDCYELYKADADLIAKYGAKDTILTYNLFYGMIEELFDEGLDKFFYEDESMPLLRGPTTDLNNTGLKVDMQKLATLKKTLEVEILELKATIYHEITPLVKPTYDMKTKKGMFNIGSGGQLAWLLFERLGETFPKLSDAGQDVAGALGSRIPRSALDKRNFIQLLKDSKDQVWRQKGLEWDKKARKYKGEGKVRDYWHYLSTDKVVMGRFAQKYRWVEKLLEYKKLDKLLNTYVLGIEKEQRYGVIHPNFLQHGTTSGRYSCKKPNLQNLPRDDKRVKACFVSRPGKVFVEADYSQLEPRVFASLSEDERLIKCFASGDDFYSVIGVDTFSKHGCGLKKGEPGSFSILYPKLRDASKVIALATVYGNTAYRMAGPLGKPAEECQTIIDNYLASYPSVHKLMLDAHEQAKEHGVVYSLYGRPRRMPDAMKIPKGIEHSELPYEHRNLLNLAINHRVQSTGASIMNRASIRCYNLCRQLEATDPAWSQVCIVLQVHDALTLEGPEHLAEDMVAVLKNSMENAAELPGVALVADPKIGRNLSEMK